MWLVVSVLLVSGDRQFKKKNSSLLWKNASRLCLSLCLSAWLFLHHIHQHLSHLSIPLSEALTDNLNKVYMDIAKLLLYRLVSLQVVSIDICNIRALGNFAFMYY